MVKSDCFILGKVTKPHALKGEVIIWLDVDNPNDYADMDAVFLDMKNELVPFMLEEIQIRGKKSIAKFEDINTIEQTVAIIGADLYLPLKALPKLKGKQFYFHEIIGYEIIEAGKVLGKIKAVYESSSQDLFAIDMNEIEVLIPIVDEFIQKIDRENSQIEVILPEGLIDVYLNN